MSDELQMSQEKNPNKLNEDSIKSKRPTRRKSNADLTARAESFQGILENLARTAVERGASDIHVAPNAGGDGYGVRTRVDGSLLTSTGVSIAEADLEAWLAHTLGEVRQDELERAGWTEFAFTLPGISRVRALAFKQMGRHALAMHLLPLHFPVPQALGLPEAVISLAGRHRGLTLVAGVAGSGLTTTLSSLAVLAAQGGGRSVLTLESPVEYLLDDGMGVISQREIGTDCASYADAMKAALRQDADVICVGEVADQETAALMLSAAEMGRMVFAAVPARDSAGALSSFAASFGQGYRKTALERLSDVLEAVVVQQLLPRQGGGRVAAFELLPRDPAIPSLVREDRIQHISSYLSTSRNEGILTMDDAIYGLYMKSAISAETAVEYAHDAAGMQRKLRLY